MKLIGMLLILSALLLILFQRVDVNVVKNETLTVKINFTFFAIVLTDDGTKGVKPENAKMLFKYFKAILKSAKHLISKTGVKDLNARFGYDRNGKGRIFLDLTLHISLLHMIISALILLYYIIKSKVKRVRINV